MKNDIKPMTRRIFIRSAVSVVVIFVCRILGLVDISDVVATLLYSFFLMCIVISVIFQKIVESIDKKDRHGDSKK